MQCYSSREFDSIEINFHIICNLTGNCNLTDMASFLHTSSRHTSLPIKEDLSSIFERRNFFKKEEFIFPSTKCTCT